MRKIILAFTFLLVLVLGALVLVVDHYVEPRLRSRLQTLVVEGSDSLYTFELESLNASFLGARVEVKNLRIRVDSARYYARKAANTLPSLTMQLDLGAGEMRGIAVLPLVLGRAVRISSISSEGADLKFYRHGVPDTLGERPPLWKSIQGSISSIEVESIRFNRLKMLYRYADTAGKMKLQFDRCDAVLEDIRIDSASSADTGRLGFARHLDLRFEDLKFRTSDSTRKMKAERISFSSRGRILEVEGFKVQPTREDPASFYAAERMQKAMQVTEVDIIRLYGLQLDQFVHRNGIMADTLLLLRPKVQVFLDKGQPPNPVSKVGRFPHQLLMQSDERYIIGLLKMQDASVLYEEQAATGGVGRLTLEGIDVEGRHLTNDRAAVQQRSVMDIRARGRILSGELDLNLRFHLDSSNGAFAATGEVRSVEAGSLNALSLPLAGIAIRSLQIDTLRFQVRGNDFGATSVVDFRYRDLNLELRDKQTGEEKSGLLTRVLNNYVVHQGNPGPGGLRREGRGRVARPSFLGFFGLIWKAIFSGMQEVMVRPPE